METIKPKSSMKTKTRFARTFQKVINLRNATRIASSNGICVLVSHNKFKEDSSIHGGKSQIFERNEEDVKARNRAVMEALVAKLFASVTSIKAAYAELQMAQSPYNGDAIQAADQAVVDELKVISELKRSFLKKELDLSPQVTLMLSEIQEQQSLMKTYEITIKKLQAESEQKDTGIVSLKKKLGESISFNKSLEKKLNASGSLSMFDNLQFPLLNPTHFAQFLHYTLRSIRNFVKLMIREMEAASWDLNAAVQCIVDSDTKFPEPTHRSFAFESFVCKTMFEGFTTDANFFLQNDSIPHDEQQNQQMFDKFKKLKPVNPKIFISQNPNSTFAKFTRSKYLQLVHAKMECSLFGNLNQRKIMNSGGVPDTTFFAAFAEMSKRVWLLRCLAFSLHNDVTIFQVRKNSRFSEVYMQCVTEETLFSPADMKDSAVGSGSEPRVRFTVVPGFKIGETVVQSRVYLSPPSR